jgi:hypothetical protein
MTARWRCSSARLSVARAWRLAANRRSIVEHLTQCGAQLRDQLCFSHQRSITGGSMVFWVATPTESLSAICSGGIIDLHGARDEMPRDRPYRDDERTGEHQPARTAPPRSGPANTSRRARHRHGPHVWSPASATWAPQRRNHRRALATFLPLSSPLPGFPSPAPVFPPRCTHVPCSVSRTTPTRHSP